MKTGAFFGRDPAADALADGADMTRLRVPHYLTRDEKGLWFRIFVLVRLRLIIGRPVFKKSPRTIDAVTAAARACGLAARYAWAFTIMEAGRMSGDEDALKAGLAALYGGTADAFKVKNGPNGPEAEIEPHDTPDTIAAGMAGYGRALETWAGHARSRAQEIVSTSLPRGMVGAATHRPHSVRTDNKRKK